MPSRSMLCSTFMLSTACSVALQSWSLPWGAQSGGGGSHHPNSQGCDGEAHGAVGGVVWERPQSAKAGQEGLLVGGGNIPAEMEHGEEGQGRCF